MKTEMQTATENIHYEDQGEFVREELKSGNILRFEIPEEKLRYSFQKISSITDEYSRQQLLSFRLIRNLFKKINYLNRVQLLENAEISEDDFNSEIENKPQKYIIDIIEILEERDQPIISNFVREFYEQTEDYSESDWGELFSLKPEEIKLITENLYKHPTNWQNLQKSLNQ